MTDPTQTPLLETRALTKHFKVGGTLSRRKLHAVDDVDLVINRNEILTLVGESGSGKSTVARLLARVYKPTRGDITYQGSSVSRMRTRRQSLAYRREVPMVFQDPYSSLNPAYRVSHGIMRVLKLHRPDLKTRRDRHQEAIRVLESVGLAPGIDFFGQYPHELSGGQRQRIGFAQALAYHPKLIIADEPVSMLDVSIRIGLLNLMAQLREQHAVSILYITHDIASARYISDRLMVMYAGRIVEQGPVEQVISNPRHPYTQLLLAAVPDPRAPVSLDSDAETGEPPRVINPTPGCRFRWRCPLATEICAQLDPELRDMGPGHVAACHHAMAGPSGTRPDTKGEAWL
ncbi:MAG: oligopeptide/dipeptide ABC transporter ATP-binding protein [Nocardioidaceae bacterium]